MKLCPERSKYLKLSRLQAFATLWRRFFCLQHCESYIFVQPFSLYPFSTCKNTLVRTIGWTLKCTELQQSSRTVWWGRTRISLGRASSHGWCYAGCCHHVGGKWCRGIQRQLLYAATIAAQVVGVCLLTLGTSCCCQRQTEGHQKSQLLTELLWKTAVHPIAAHPVHE